MAIRVLILIILFVLNSLLSLAAGERVKINADDFITGVFRSPSGVYYCGTHQNGILRSTDSGATWSRHAGKSESPTIECASRIQTNDDKYIVVFVLDIERSDYTLLSSSDSCKTWKAIIPGKESPQEASKAVLLKNNKTIVLNAQNRMSVLDSGASATKPIPVINNLAAQPIDFSVSKDGSVFILMDNGSIVKLHSDLEDAENIEFNSIPNDRPIKIQVTELGRFYVYTEKYDFYLLSTIMPPEELYMGVPEDGREYVYDIASAGEEYFVAKYNNYLTDFNVFNTVYYQRSTKSHDTFYSSSNESFGTTFDFFFSDDCMYFNLGEFYSQRIDWYIYSVSYGLSTSINDFAFQQSKSNFSFDSQVNPTSIEIPESVQKNELCINAYDESGNRLDTFELIGDTKNSSIGLNCNVLPNGVYFISIGIGDSRITKKFLKTK